MRRPRTAERGAAKTQGNQGKTGCEAVDRWRNSPDDAVCALAKLLGDGISLVDDKVLVEDLENFASVKVRHDERRGVEEMEGRGGELSANEGLVGDVGIFLEMRSFDLDDARGRTEIKSERTCRRSDTHTHTHSVTRTLGDEKQCWRTKAQKMVDSWMGSVMYVGWLAGLVPYIVFSWVVVSVSQSPGLPVATRES